MKLPLSREPERRTPIRREDRVSPKRAGSETGAPHTRFKGRAHGSKAMEASHALGRDGFHSVPDQSLRRQVNRGVTMERPDASVVPPSPFWQSFTPRFNQERGGTRPYQFMVPMRASLTVAPHEPDSTTDYTDSTDKSASPSAKSAKSVVQELFSCLCRKLCRELCWIFEQNRPVGQRLRQSLGQSLLFGTSSTARFGDAPAPAPRPRPKAAQRMYREYFVSVLALTTAMQVLELSAAEAGRFIASVSGYVLDFEHLLPPRPVPLP